MSDVSAEITTYFYRAARKKKEIWIPAVVATISGFSAKDCGLWSTGQWDLNLKQFSGFTTSIIPNR